MDWIGLHIFCTRAHVTFSLWEALRLARRLRGGSEHNQRFCTSTVQTPIKQFYDSESWTAHTHTPTHATTCTQGCAPSRRTLTRARRNRNSSLAPDRQACREPGQRNFEGFLVHTHAAPWRLSSNNRPSGPDVMSGEGEEGEHEEHEEHEEHWIARARADSASHRQQTFSALPRSAWAARTSPRLVFGRRGSRSSSMVAITVLVLESDLELLRLAPVMTIALH